MKKILTSKSDRDALESAIRTIETVASKLRDKQGVCPTCGLLVYENKMEHKMKFELLATAKKLRNLSEG